MKRKNKNKVLRRVSGEQRAHELCMTYIVRERPFNLKEGGYGFLFRSEIFFRTTQELEYYFFFVARNANFFFQNLTLGYMTKTLNQIIFFPPPK